MQQPATEKGLVLLPSPKRLQRNAETEDLISSLPDEILCSIITLLPFESAIQTSFLSNRWKGLWKTDVLRHGAREDIVNEVEGFVTCFDELDPLMHPRRLRFHFSHESVLIATIAPYNKLHLGFSTREQEQEQGQESPNNQFSWALRLNRQNLNQQQPSYSSGYFVKSLHLTSVGHLTSGAVSSIVSKFRYLESLVIIKCSGLTFLRVYGCSQLCKLTVFDCPQLKSLSVVAFNLQSLRLRGMLPRCLIKRRHQCLEDVMLDSRIGPGYNSSFKYHHHHTLIKCILDVKILTLCKWTLETLIIPWLSSGRPDFRFKKLKDLWWIASSIEEENIDALFSFLKLCPSLENLFINIDPTSYSMPSTGESSNQGNMHTQLDHLKVVKLEGLISRENQILLAERLLEVMRTEPVIIATKHGKCMQRLVRMNANQPKQQETMGDKIVVTPKGKNYTYEFVEVAEDADEFCLKHLHMNL